MLNEVLVIIPARGGSKGIPGKNLKVLGSHTLVGHSIQHALGAGIPNNNIIVSSDSDDILQEAHKYGVVASLRPADLSGDLSSTEATMLFIADVYERAMEGKPMKHMLLLQPTSPIRFSMSVNGFLKEYFDHLDEFDSLMAVTKFYDFFWYCVYDENGKKWISTYDPVKRPMRQKMSEGSLRHFDNGNMYITRIKTLRETQSRCGGNVNIFKISELEGSQIDSPEDLCIFEHIFSGGIEKLCLSESTKVPLS